MRCFLERISLYKLFKYAVCVKSSILMVILTIQ